jgi:hypothetical protein
MSKTQISTTEFKKARLTGSTVKQLAQQFGISEANCKLIIKQLGLPKRAVAPGFVLVDDENISTESVQESQWSETTIN